MRARTDRILGGLVAAALGLAAAAHAETALSDEEARALFEARYCNACHEVDETRLGPAFRTVGLRYRDAPLGAETESWLATKIVTGGAGSSATCRWWATRSSRPRRHARWRARARAAEEGRAVTARREGPSPREGEAVPA